MSYYAEWNRPNYQHRASPREFKTHRHPDGTLERKPYDEIDGYDDWGRIARPSKAYAAPKGKPLDPNPRLRAAARLRHRQEVIRVR